MVITVNIYLSNLLYKIILFLSVNIIVYPTSGYTVSEDGYVRTSDWAEHKQIYFT